MITPVHKNKLMSVTSTKDYRNHNKMNGTITGVSIATNRELLMKLKHVLYN
jgi:hypothetical protein